MVGWVGSGSQHIDKPKVAEPEGEQRCLQPSGPRLGSDAWIIRGGNVHLADQAKRVEPPDELIHCLNTGKTFFEKVINVHHGDGDTLPGNVGHPLRQPTWQAETRFYPLAGKFSCRPLQNIGYGDTQHVVHDQSVGTRVDVVVLALVPTIAGTYGLGAHQPLAVVNTVGGWVDSDSILDDGGDGGDGSWEPELTVWGTGTASG